METEALQFKPYDKFTGHGDTREVQYGPFTLRATVQFDEGTKPTDDCFTSEDITAWQRGDWDFIGIVLSVWVDDLCLDDHAASLWGIECNFPESDNDYLAECANAMLDKAIEAAEAARTKLLVKLEKQS